MPVLVHSSAYLLVSHGSRDPRPQKAAVHLADLVSQRLSSPDRSPIVATAALELAPIPLYKAIYQQAQKHQLERLYIVPLFLLPGVHSREDIPAEVATAQAQLDQTELYLHPYIGSYPGMIAVLEQQFQQLPHGARLLISHGSRREGANQPIEAIAAKLNAKAAYWAVEPSLEAQVTALVNAGHTEIVIQPYFLFSGGIIDAIAQTVAMLQSKFPQVRFHWGQALGATPALADLIVRGIHPSGQLFQ